jgi:hypothetical protein
VIGEHQVPVLEELDPSAILGMLADPSNGPCFTLGDERVICGPGDLRDALVRLDAALLAAVEGNRFRIALLTNDEDERRMIATTLVERAKELGCGVKLIRDSWGMWARDIKKTDDRGHAVHVLEGVPPEAKALEAFAAFSGSLILLWPLEYAGSVLLPDQIEEVIVPPFSDRPLDKAAQVIYATWIALNLTGADDGEAVISLFRKLDRSALLGVFLDRTKIADVGNAKKAGQRLAELLRTHAALRPGESLNAAEVHGALYSQPEQLPPNLRRLWVEGDTDRALFELADRLMQKGVPWLLDGIRLESLGGAEQVENALRRCRRDPRLELFMFDADEEGRRAARKVEELKIPALVLDRDAAMSACDTEWVIEDLLSVACLDRFYFANPQLKPLREEIGHHPDGGRRLVVRGEDKGTLVAWLETVATIDDVFGLHQQMASIRKRFALRYRAVPTSAPADGFCGLRPRPWWFVFET